MFALCVLNLSVAQGAPIETPIAEVPGKSTPVTFDVMSEEGGLREFSDFDPSQFDELYFGTRVLEPLKAGFDGELVALEFLSVDGTLATWAASTIWNLPDPLVVPLRCQVDVTGLGESPWVDAVSVGLPATLGAAIANPTGADFTLWLRFEADYGDGFVPLDEYPPQDVGVRQGVIFGFAAYVVRPIPEPSTLALLAIGGLAMLCCTRGPRRRRVRIR
jgi:hypothetical protein